MAARTLPARCWSHKPIGHVGSWACWAAGWHFWPPFCSRRDAPSPHVLALPVPCTAVPDRPGRYVTHMSGAILQLPNCFKVPVSCDGTLPAAFVWPAACQARSHRGVHDAVHLVMPPLQLSAVPGPFSLKFELKGNRTAAMGPATMQLYYRVGVGHACCTLQQWPRAGTQEMCVPLHNGSDCWCSPPAAGHTCAVARPCLAYRLHAGASQAQVCSLDPGRASKVSLLHPLCRPTRCSMG
jgi:hypothetical protein